MQKKKLWGEKKFNPAAREFDDLLSSYRWRYTEEVLLNNPDKIASLCDEPLLDAWFERDGGHSSVYQRLAVLAGEIPQGDVIKKALIRRAKDCYFEDYYSSEWKQHLLLALGDMGVEETLLEILHKAREKSFLRRLLGAECDPRLYVALGKIGSDEVLRQLQHEVKKTSNWVLHFVTARLLAERNDPQALELLLKGKQLRGDKKWEAEFGPEPTLWHLAWRFGAKITKAGYADSQEYLAASQSRDFKFRVRA